MLKFIMHARISLDISIHDGVSYANLDLNYVSNHFVHMFIFDSFISRNEVVHYLKIKMRKKETRYYSMVNNGILSGIESLKL